MFLWAGVTRRLLRELLPSEQCGKPQDAAASLLQPLVQEDLRRRHQEHHAVPLHRCGFTVHPVQPRSVRDCMKQLAVFHGALYRYISCAHALPVQPARRADECNRAEEHGRAHCLSLVFVQPRPVGRLQRARPLRAVGVLAQFLFHTVRGEPEGDVSVTAPEARIDGRELQSLIKVSERNWRGALPSQTFGKQFFCATFPEGAVAVS